MNKNKFNFIYGLRKIIGAMIVSFSIKEILSMFTEYTYASTIAKYTFIVCSMLYLIGLSIYYFFFGIERYAYVIRDKCFVTSEKVFYNLSYIYFPWLSIMFFVCSRLLRANDTSPALVASAAAIFILIPLMLLINEVFLGEDFLIFNLRKIDYQGIKTYEIQAISQSVKKKVLKLELIDDKIIYISKPQEILKKIDLHIRSRKGITI